MIVARRHQVIEPGQGLAGGRPGNLDLLGLRRIIELDQEHEPIELGLGQGIRPSCSIGFCVASTRNGVVKGKGLADHGHVVFLHRLEHRRLGLRWGPVDLVGQYDVREDRPVHELELPLAAGHVLKDIRARDVHRHQVGRELDPAELQRHGLGQLADQQCLGQPGHAHEQGMTPREQANRQPFDHLVLADDDPADLPSQPCIDFAQVVDRLNVIFAQSILRFRGH